MNPLKAAYNAPVSGVTTQPVTTPAAPAQSTSTAPSPAASGRDLGALRAKLAGRFVNPPEAPNAINEDTLAPRTVETPDGGATPAPGWVETKPGLVVRTTTDATPAVSAAPTKSLTRGQAAAATRAANKAAQAQPAPSVAAPGPSETTAAPPAVSSDLARIASALERLADWADVWGGRL